MHPCCYVESGMNKLFGSVVTVVENPGLQPCAGLHGFPRISAVVNLPRCNLLSLSGRKPAEVLVAAIPKDSEYRDLLI